MMDDSKEETKITEVLKLLQEIDSELQSEGMEVSPLRQSSPDKWFALYSKYLHTAHAVLRIHVGKHRNVEVRYYIHYGRIKQNKKNILNDKLLEKQNEIRKYIADNLSNKYQRVDTHFKHWDAFLYPSKSVSWDDLINYPEKKKAYLKDALIEMWADFENVLEVILDPNTVVTKVQKVEVIMPNTKRELILSLISKYKEIVRETGNKNELYKWQLAQKNLGKPDLDVQDLKAEIGSIKFGNLVYQMAPSVMLQLTVLKPISYRKALLNLFDEQLPLETRINDYQDSTSKMFKEAGSKLQSHQDERTAATLLTFHNPDKYTFYKDAIYQQFCKYIGIEPKKTGQKYAHYLELINELIEDYIKPDNELIVMINGLLTEDAYKDKKHMILAQDILYQNLDQVKVSHRKDLYELCRKIKAQRIAQGELDPKDYVRTRFIKDERYLFLESNELRLSGRLYYKNDEFMQRYEDEVLSILVNPRSESGIYRRAADDKLSSEFINESFKKDEIIIFPLDKDYVNKETEQLETYVQLTKDTCEQLLKLNPGYSIADSIEILARLITRDATGKKYGFPLDVLYPVNDSYELIPGFTVIQKSGNSVLISTQKTVSRTTKQEISMNHPLNHILYGPPGTGKTYNTVNKALEILNFDIRNKTRKEIKDLFDENSKNGRIIFTTFHQSMCYEDFIEGIKPTLTDNDEKSLSYVLADGLFKRLCLYTKYDIYSSLHKQQDVTKLTRDRLYDLAYENLLSEISAKLDNGEKYELETKMKLPLEVIGISDLSNINVQHTKNRTDTRHTVSKQRLLKLFLKYQSIDNILKVNQDITEVIGGSNTSSYWALLNRLYKIASKVVSGSSKIIEPEIPDYETIKTVTTDFTISKDDLEKLEKTNRINNYVLIIDEINRGNVSQIFGELITLIEEDKRQGKAEALEVTLPYSHDKFSVPPNLYIIGTMNTADRSIEALDTALRRRFCFEEIKPLYDLPELLREIETISLSSLLKTINQRIEKLVDKDHMIGHSYLMSVRDVADLKHAFHNKIIPLLQEYFYGDYGKIGLVLREGFFLNGGKQDSKEEYILADFNDYQVDDLNSRHIYRLLDVAQMNDDVFIAAIQTLLKSK